MDFLHALAAWASFGLALILAVDRIAGRFVTPKWAHLSDLAGLERVTSDRINDVEKEVLELRGKLNALPTSIQMEEIRKEVGELKIKQAAGNERMEAVREDVHEMRRLLERAMQTGARP